MANSLNRLRLQTEHKSLKSSPKFESRLSEFGILLMYRCVLTCLINMSKELLYSSLNICICSTPKVYLSLRAACHRDFNRYRRKYMLNFIAILNFQHSLMFSSRSNRRATISDHSDVPACAGTPRGSRGTVGIAGIAKKRLVAWAAIGSSATCHVAGAHASKVRPRLSLKPS